MTGREEKIVTWLIPTLMTAILSLVGWMALNIERMSENLAVVVFRVESQAASLQDINHRVHDLEIFAAAKQQRPR